MVAQRMHSHLTNSADHTALRCARCHYVLDDPSKMKVCPECGLDIQPSLDLHNLLASPHVLDSSIAPACRLLLGGALLAAIGVLIAASIAVSGFGGAWPAVELVAWLLMMIASIITTVGSILLATSPMTDRDALSQRRAQWIVLITTSLKIVVQLIWFVSLCFIVFDLNPQQAVRPSAAIMNETRKLFLLAILPIAAVQWLGMQQLYKCVLDAVGLRRSAKHVFGLLLAPFVFAVSAVWLLHVTVSFPIYPFFEALGFLCLVAIPTSIAITWLIPTRAIARKQQNRDAAAADLR